MDDDIYTQPVNDGLLLRESGLWAAEKLCFLNRYLNMLTQSMSSKSWRSIRYIDMFSGPGKCIIRDTKDVLLGSPLLALSAKRYFTDYVFVDMGYENIDCLKQRTQSFLSKSRISYLVGDSNKIVKSIIAEILEHDNEFIRGSWTSLNLAFLDPEGLELEWSTVAELARVRTDLIIHYSQFGITRNLDNFAQVSSDTAIDRFFGGREWREIYAAHFKAPGKMHSDLLNLYHSRLTDLGYVDIKGLGNHFDPLMKTTETNAPLYRLIYASKHPLGHKFWDQVTKKDVYGQERFL
jgi:three-Cys-motif partner protein